MNGVTWWWHDNCFLKTMDCWISIPNGNKVIYFEILQTRTTHLLDHSEVLIPRNLDLPTPSFYEPFYYFANWISTFLPLNRLTNTLGTIPLLASVQLNEIYHPATTPQCEPSTPPIRCFWRRPDGTTSPRLPPLNDVLNLCRILYANLSAKLNYCDCSTISCWNVCTIRLMSPVSRFYSMSSFWFRSPIPRCRLPAPSLT